MTSSTHAAPVPLRPGPAAAAGFDGFCRAHAPRLLAYLRRRTRSTQDAEDVCQETLTRAWRHWQDVLALACPHAWLYVVADRLLIDGWRRRAAADSFPAPKQSGGAGLDHCDALAVRRAVAALPQDVRNAVVLYYFEDWTVRRIASDAGVSTQTVKSRLHRGRAALAGQLRRLGPRGLMPADELDALRGQLLLPGSLRRASKLLCRLGHGGISSPCVTWTFSSQRAQ